MKKIFLILPLALCACESEQDKQKAEFDKMVQQMRSVEYTNCVSYAQKEFKKVNISEIEKTCACAADYIWDINDIRTSGDKEAFAKDFVKALKNICGKYIPRQTLKGIPSK